MASIHFSTISLVLLVGTVACHMAMVMAERKVDCRRVVFHPYCRGISAKRANLQMIREEPSKEEVDEQMENLRPEDAPYNDDWITAGHPKIAPLAPRQFPFEIAPMALRADTFYYPRLPIFADSRRGGRFASYYGPWNEPNIGQYKPTFLRYTPDVPVPFDPLHLNDYHDVRQRQNRVLAQPHHHSRRVPRQHPIVAPYDLDYFPYKKH